MKTITTREWKKLLYSWRAYLSGKFYDSGRRCLHPRSHQVYADILLPFALAQQSPDYMLSGEFDKSRFIGYLQPNTLRKLADYLQLGFSEADLLLCLEELSREGVVIPVLMGPNNFPLAIISIAEAVEAWGGDPVDSPTTSLIVAAPADGPKDPSVFFQNLPKRRSKIIEDVCDDIKD